MPALPTLSGREVVRAFEKFGWAVVRQSSSHIIMTKDGEIASVSILDHREVAKGTLRRLIRAANLTVDQFTGAVCRKSVRFVQKADNLQRRNERTWYGALVLLHFPAAGIPG